MTNEPRSEEGLTVHDIKCWPEFFVDIISGKKTSEFRKNDRAYQLGDVLNLREFKPITGDYTGRNIYVIVTHIVYGGAFGIPEDCCIMSIRPRAIFKPAPAPPIITPTIGRVVYFIEPGIDEFDALAPQAAIITHVWSERMVNLVVFDPNGNGRGVTSVNLVQPGDPPSNYDRWCEWMPFQVKKSHGSESGERTAGVQSI